MRLNTSTELQSLAEIFSDAGYTLYITGGFTRDSLLFGEFKKTDMDICASAGVEEVKKILNGGAYRLKERNSALGTVAIVAESGEAYEYTAFRRDSYRRGEHTPSSVVFVGTVEEDALRRDFTVNSIYYDIAGEKIVDPTGGTEDLKNKLLKTSDKPEITFGSDGLRLLRLVRFAAALGFDIEVETKKAAEQSAHLLRDITRPRVNEEFFKILEAEDGTRAYKGLRLLSELGLLFMVVPELRASYDFPQNKKWHEFDVLEHTFKTLELCRPETRMAALLHDIGKPYSEQKYGNSHHHTEIALELSPKILKEFEYSHKRASRTLRLIEHHMYDLDSAARENKIKKFILENHDIFEDLLDLKQADYLATGKYSDICPTVEKWRGIYNDMQNGPLDIKDLAITPTELISELKGIMPQTDTAKVMGKLLLSCAVEKIKNERETLLNRARSYYS